KKRQCLSYGGVGGAHGVGKEVAIEAPGSGRRRWHPRGQEEVAALGLREESVVASGLGRRRWTWMQEVEVGDVAGTVEYKEEYEIGDD
ncbi:hypothetical protein E2562_011947, partial [Oryza meyeriana var. granulata]